jgi:hypothetical protein
MRFSVKYGEIQQRQILYSAKIYHCPHSYYPQLTPEEHTLLSTIQASILSPTILSVTPQPPEDTAV